MTDEEFRAGLTACILAPYIIFGIIGIAWWVIDIIRSIRNGRK